MQKISRDMREFNGVACTEHIYHLTIIAGPLLCSAVIELHVFALLFHDENTFKLIHSEDFKWRLWAVELYSSQNFFIFLTFIKKLVQKTNYFLLLISLKISYIHKLFSLLVWKKSLTCKIHVGLKCFSSKISAHHWSKKLHLSCHRRIVLWEYKKYVIASKILLKTIPFFKGEAPRVLDRYQNLIPKPRSNGFSCVRCEV